MGELQRPGPRERATVPAPDHERSPHSALIVVETVRSAIATGSTEAPPPPTEETALSGTGCQAAARRARYSVSVVSVSVVSLSEPSIVFGASLTEIATLRGCFASGLGM